MHKFSHILFLLLVSFTSNYAVMAQSSYFEGKVTYSIKEFDALGAPRSTPVDREEIFFTKEVILTKPLSGPYPLMFGRTDIYLNAERNVRYSVDHVNRLIKNLGASSDVEEIVPIEENKIGEEDINGFNCDVTFLKYVHKIEGLYGPMYDTLRCTYYNSKKFTIENLNIFTLLQGNKNSLIIDGRYHGIPAKVILKTQDGSTILYESMEIIQMNVDELIKLPPYPIEE